MRSASYVEETTTSISGASGDGAVTLTAITNTPRFSTVFGSSATSIRYVIEDTVNKKFESGLGSVASNVLTRTRPQITWTGTTWDDSTPSPLAFGSSPTSGDIKIRLSVVAEDLAPVIRGVNNTIAGDASWRDYPFSANVNLRTAASASAVTASDELYTLYCLNSAGSLTGVQCDVQTAVAASNMKWALYPCGSNGLPGSKIVDFVSVSTASTGIKTDTATGSWSPAGPVWLTPGWYYIGWISDGAIALRGSQSTESSSCLTRTPLGRQGGYGYGNTVLVAGSYASGLPTAPAPTTMVAANTARSVVWFGLRVVP